MNVALSPTFYGAGARRSAERRLSLAIGASLLIHVLALAALRGIAPAMYVAPKVGTGGFSSLQAVLAAPKPEEPPERARAERVPEPAVVPPAAHPLEPPMRRRSPQPVLEAGGDPERTGASLLDFSIAVGTIDDPAKLGWDFVVRLAARFPERISKPPLMIGTPVMSYPQAALEAGAQGSVAALVMLRTDGTIDEVQLAHDAPLLGPAALEALKDVRFTPAEIDGKPVPYWAIVEFVFLIGRPAPSMVPQAPARRGPIISRQPGANR